VGLFSSKGTALIVTVTLIIRTVTDPFLASAAIIGAIIVGLLIWNAYGDIIREYWEQIDKQIEELRTSDTEEAFLEES
jgi:xanthine/uracil permease